MGSKLAATLRLTFVIFTLLAAGVAPAKAVPVSIGVGVDLTEIVGGTTTITDEITVTPIVTTSSSCYSPKGEVGLRGKDYRIPVGPKEYCPGSQYVYIDLVGVGPGGFRTIRHPEIELDGGFPPSGIWWSSQCNRFILNTECVQPGITAIAINFQAYVYKKNRFLLINWPGTGAKVKTVTLTLEFVPVAELLDRYARDQECESFIHATTQIRREAWSRLVAEKLPGWYPYGGDLWSAEYERNAARLRPSEKPSKALTEDDIDKRIDARVMPILKEILGEVRNPKKEQGSTEGVACRFRIFGFPAGCQIVLVAAKEKNPACYFDSSPGNKGPFSLKPGTYNMYLVKGEENLTKGEWSLEITVSGLYMITPPGIGGT